MGRQATGKQDKRPAADATSNAAVPAGALAIVAIVIATAIVFGQNASHSFLNYDDPQFVTENTQVRQGLNPVTVSWALRSASLGWYPLTWMSHMLDVQMWGMRPGAHLLMNAFLHALTACLLFFTLRRLTARWAGSVAAWWASAFVALLFAIHPMHVESVAWISERKDTLSTLFAAIALLFYANAPARIGRVTVAMALSLMAKQMYVTLPFLLLLLDFWPLQRLGSRVELRRRAIEKWPLLILALAGSCVAVIGQQNLRALQPSAAVPVVARLANAATAYVFYIAKLFVPLDLAVPYPLSPVRALPAAAAFALLLAITAAAIALRNRAPYFTVGWFWFTGTLIPVIGVVTIGAQSMADRYSYFPSIGLCIAAAFGVVALIARIAQTDPERSGRAAALAVMIGGAVVLTFALVAFRQAGYWKNSETLFSHSIAVTGPNPMAEYSLGQALELTGPDNAIPHLQRSVEIVEAARREHGVDPPEWYSQAYVGLGTARLALAQQRPLGTSRTDLINRAVLDLQRSLAINATAPHAVNNLGVAMQMKQGDAARAHPAGQPTARTST